MEFFSVKESAGFNFTDKKNLNVNINLEATEMQAPGTFSVNKIYFSTEKTLDLVKQILKQNNKEQILIVSKSKEKIYSQFLEKKDIWFNKNDKLLSLPENQLKIALVFDIRPTFDANFSNALENGLNYFYNKLAEFYQDVQLDVFTIYLSEWLELAVNTPVTGLNIMPEALDKLLTYDAFVKFSDIVNENYFVELEKIDICLRVLNSPLNPLPMAGSKLYQPGFPSVSCSNGKRGDLKKKINKAALKVPLFSGLKAGVKFFSQLVSRLI
jgi:hypothetical protein